MSDFEARLIEDLGHEISDVVIAGEELLRAPDRGQDRLDGARDFRRLLATLEVGCRLLQWGDLEFLLTEMGAKFDDAFDRRESPDSIRGKMEKTVAVLLDIHQNFDGVRFSSEQLDSWSNRVHEVWTELGVLDHEAYLQKISEVPDELAASPVVDDLVPAASAAPQAKKLDSDELETFSVEYRGQEYVFPIGMVDGFSAIESLDAENFKAWIKAGTPLEFRGQEYDWTRLEDFRKFQKRGAGDRDVFFHEILFVNQNGRRQAILVDRVLGFQKTKLAEEEAPALVGSNEKYRSLNRRGHFVGSYLRLESR